MVAASGFSHCSAERSLQLVHGVRMIRRAGPGHRVVGTGFDIFESPGALVGNSGETCGRPNASAVADQGASFRLVAASRESSLFTSLRSSSRSVELLITT